MFVSRAGVVGGFRIVMGWFVGSGQGVPLQDGEGGHDFWAFVTVLAGVAVAVPVLLGLGKGP